MNGVGLLVVAILVLASGFNCMAQTLDGLKADRPRLLADSARFDRVRELVRTDDRARQWHANLKKRGEDMLAQPAAERVLKDGVRLLYVSREVESRVLTLALLHRLEPDRRYVDRVWLDMQAVADFSDWNPKHFLDVAEMAFACAIALDWMHDDWTPAQRQVIREAIVRHAIRPALHAYETGAWWTKTEINWNQVCNGGLIAGALAVADDEPALATKMIELAVAALPKSMERYAPEGGYDEGPGYWDYGTSFNVIAIACLESALGHDFGLGELRGFDRTGWFPIQMCGPSGVTFNFADATAGDVRSPALFYLARRYNQPMFAAFAAESNRGEPLDLLWYEPVNPAEISEALPTTALYEKVGVATVRSAWNDPAATFFAVKAGRLPGGHGQLDLGSFVLESGGVRWVVDLGRDDYNLPGYFDAGTNGRRWNFYRNRAEGHNTIVINPGRGPDQKLDAVAPISLDESTAVIDLGPAYGVQAKRSISLEQNAVSVIDRIFCGDASDLWWFVHTQAQIELADGGRVAMLSQKNKRLRVRLIEPADASFAVMPARPLPTSPDAPGQNPNDGSPLLNAAPGSSFVLTGEMPKFGEPDPAKAIRKLAIHLPAMMSTKIVVLFEPVEE